MNVARIQAVSLTPRDLALLKELYDKTVLSNQHIMQKFFPNNSKSTLTNRLSRLESCGLVKKYKVPRLSGVKDLAFSNVAFQITKAGIRELQKRNFDEHLRDEPVNLHGFTIEHDLLLIDVMDALALKFQGGDLIHGKLLNENDLPSGVHPDAVLVLPNGQGRVAIELELTLKAENRYRELIMRYRLAKAYSQVIYVTAHPSIGAKIAKVIGAHPKTLGQKFSTGKFYFTNFSDLVRASEKAAITNGHDFLKGGNVIEECKVRSI